LGPGPCAGEPHPAGREVTAIRLSRFGLLLAASQPHTHTHTHTRESVSLPVHSLLQRCSGQGEECCKMTLQKPATTKIDKRSIPKVTFRNSRGIQVWVKSRVGMGTPSPHLEHFLRSRSQIQIRRCLRRLCLVTGPGWSNFGLGELKRRGGGEEDSLPSGGGEEDVSI
jgi:hypothetical protein